MWIPPTLWQRRCRRHPCCACGSPLRPVREGTPPRRRGVPSADPARIARDLTYAAALVEELQHFRVRFTAAGHDIYGAWRSGVHDDLVLSVAAVVWLDERIDSAFREPLAPKR